MGTGQLYPCINHLKSLLRRPSLSAIHIRLESTNAAWSIKRMSKVSWCTTLSALHKHLDSPPILVSPNFTVQTMEHPSKWPHLWLVCPHICLRHIWCILTQIMACLKWVKKEEIKSCWANRLTNSAQVCFPRIAITPMNSFQITTPPSPSASLTRLRYNRVSVRGVTYLGTLNISISTKVRELIYSRPPLRLPSLFIKSGRPTRWIWVNNSGCSLCMVWLRDQRWCVNLNSVTECKRLPRWVNQPSNLRS